jgi:tetratricopeptide (TPR) repeat protein
MKPAINNKILMLGCLCLALAIAGCPGASNHIKRGDELMNSDLHEEALEEYQKAEEVEPDNPEVKSRLEKVRTLLATAAHADGLIMLKNKKYREAIAAFKRALGYKPDEAAFMQNLKRAAKGVLDEGRQAIADKQFRKATKIFKEVLEELPNFAEAKQGLKEAESGMTDLLYSEALDYFKRGLYGNALISVIQLRKKVGAYEGSADLEVSARDNLKNAAKFGIKVSAARVKRRLRARTDEIVERFLSVKIAECPTAAMPVSKGARLNVKVGFVGAAFSQDKETTTGEQKYRSGTRKVDNPKHLELKKQISESQEKIKRLEEELQRNAKVIEEAREAMADAGPEDDEAALRKRLKDAEKKRSDHRADLKDTENRLIEYRGTIRRTKRKLKEPVFDVHKYDVEKVTRTCTVRIRVTARGEGGVKALDEELQGTAETSDTTNPAKKKYAVKADPLKFPVKDDDLVKEAVGNATENIAEKLGGQCQKWHAELLSRARQASTGAAIEATEDYVLYLFVSPGKPPPEVVEFLKKQRDFTTLDDLRGE